MLGSRCAKAAEMTVTGCCCWVLYYADVKCRSSAAIIARATTREPFERFNDHVNASICYCIKRPLESSWWDCSLIFMIPWPGLLDRILCIVYSRCIWYGLRPRTSIQPCYNKSKSSSYTMSAIASSHCGTNQLTSSLYFMIVLFLALVSTHVTKSSICLVMSMAGSVIGWGPTRMWPCSMVLTACRFSL